MFLFFMINISQIYKIIFNKQQKNKKILQK